MGTERGSLLLFISRGNKVCGFVLGRINFRKTQCLSHSEIRIPSDKYTVSRELSMFQYMHSVFLLMRFQICGLIKKLKKIEFFKITRTPFGFNFHSMCAAG